MSDTELKNAQQKLADKVMGLPGVSGTAIGLDGGKPCLKVYVKGGGDSARSKIPSKVEGVRVVVEVSGSEWRLVGAGWRRAIRDDFL